jgi:hypothetical protein
MPNRELVTLEDEERRGAKRYRFTFPLKVSWSGTRETLTETVDVSTRGVYFLLSEPLAVGTPIEFVLTLLLGQDEAKPVRLNCHGHVQRTDAAADGRMGVAASIDSYEFAHP